MRWGESSHETEAFGRNGTCGVDESGLAFRPCLRGPRASAFDQEKIRNALGRIRTYSQQIMLTSYAFRRPFRVCGLDFLFSALGEVCCQVSTPSDLIGLARDHHSQ